MVSIDSVMKEQLNLRVSNLTRRQLDQLMAWWGTSQTETVTVIIDRAFLQERNKAVQNNLTEADIVEQLRQLADDSVTDDSVMDDSVMDDWPQTEQESNHL